MTRQPIRCIGSMMARGDAQDCVCLVCHGHVPDGLGVYQVHLGALTHQEGCNAVIVRLERVPGRMPRDRKRPLRELIALANGAHCSICGAVVLARRRTFPGGGEHSGIS